MSKPDSPYLAALREQAAAAAVTFVKSGMVVGLGGGRTVAIALRRIADQLASGQLHHITGVPCSFEVERTAQQFGIPQTTLDDQPQIDLTIDGADEVDPDLNLIKGGGGSLLREKMVAQASRREIIVVDESKLSPHLGAHWALPVEVIQFGWRAQVAYLESLGARVRPRQKSDDTLFQTNQGNLVLDCNFGPIADLDELAGRLEKRAGIVEHGLFLGLATDVIVAGKAGIRHLTTDRRQC